jgi:hypothetical protein
MKRLVKIVHAIHTIREKGKPETDSLLQEVLHFQMAFNEGEPNFRNCAGWLDHWKGHYEVRTGKNLWQEITIGRTGFI